MSAARSSSVLRANLRLCSYEGVVAMPIVFLSLPGNFVIAMLLAQVFQLSETAFGIIASLPAWCNVLQLVAMPLLTRRWTQKRITVTFGWIHLVIWMALLVALPFIPPDDERSASRILFWIFLFASLSHAVVAVSWTSWVQEWTPARIRGKFFGARNRIMQIATVAFLVIAGELLHRLSATNPVEAFQILIAFAAALRVFSLTWQARILSTSASRSHEAASDWMEQLQLVRQAPSLVRFIGFGAAFGFAASFFGPFFTVYMLEVLHLPVVAISHMVILGTIFGAIAMPAWGRMLDRFGNRPVMTFCLIGWMAPGYLWVLTTPERTWMLYPMFAWGGFISAGFLLGSFNLLLKLVPPAAKTLAISLHVAATSLAAAIAPVLGGAFLDLCWALELGKLPVYHGAAVVHHTAVMATALMLHRVVEPKSTSLSQVVGAMRSYRQIVALFGLSFLGNYTFFGRRRPD